MKQNSVIRSAAFSVLIVLFCTVNAFPADRSAQNAAFADAHFISSAALKALRHIAQARADIHDRDIPHAKDELMRAMDYIDNIRTSLPTATVRDRIWVAKKHASYEVTDEVLHDLVHIYASLAEIEDLVAVERARQHINRARENLKKGNREGAGRELTLADESLIYTEMDLPLSYIEKHIASARDFLANNSAVKADDELKAAEEGLRFLSIDTYAPLAQAQRSLWQAFRDEEAGDRAAVKRYLREVKAALEEAVKSGDERIKVESEALLKDIADAENKINEEADISQGTLKSLWQRTKALYELTAERIATGWRQIGTRDPLRTQLMEIKLYVTYAETYQLTAGDPDRALVEINRATEYIQEHPLSGASEITKAQLQEITEELKEMKTRVHEKNLSVKLLYEDIRAQLGELIQNP